MAAVNISYDELWAYATECLVKAGSSRENASTVAKVLAQADLRGITSHGVNRLGGIRGGEGGTCLHTYDIYISVCVYVYV